MFTKLGYIVFALALVPRAPFAHSRRFSSHPRPDLRTPLRAARALLRPSNTARLRRAAPLVKRRHQLSRRRQTPPAAGACASAASTVRT